MGRFGKLCAMAGEAMIAAVPAMTPRLVMEGKDNS
jgi:hypothetical protein